MNDKDRIRMELYKEVYLQWSTKIREFSGNIASSMASKAVNAFDAKFNENQESD